MVADGGHANNEKNIHVPTSAQAETSKLNNNIGLKLESSKSIFVGNLPHSALETDIYETFSVFGPVAKVEINRDMEKLVVNSVTGIPNFGFVEFYTKEAVDKALKPQQSSFIRNHELFVEKKIV